MPKITFYDPAQVLEERHRFVVIVAQHQGRWLLCKHRERATLELPGGHREPGEAVDAAAQRELYEETGAVRFELERIAAYSVSQGDGESFGMLYFAKVERLGPLPPLEIETVTAHDALPPLDRLTYPGIQPILFDKVRRSLTASPRKGTP